MFTARYELSLEIQFRLISVFITFSKCSESLLEIPQWERGSRLIFGLIRCFTWPESLALGESLVAYFISHQCSRMLQLYTKYVPPRGGVRYRVCWHRALWRSHSGVSEDSSLLRDYAVSLNERFPTFRKNVVNTWRVGSLDTWKMKALPSFETSGTTHPTTSHFPEDPNPVFTLFTRPSTVLRMRSCGAPASCRRADASQCHCGYDATACP